MTKALLSKIFRISRREAIAKRKELPTAASAADHIAKLYKEKKLSRQDRDRAFSLLPTVGD